ncbi:MAG: SCP2 sterol-binding domain-containing protein [Pseudomonadota bacterium]
MSDHETILAAMREAAPKLRGLGYRVRFDLLDAGQSYLLDGTVTPVEVGASEADTAADTVLAMTSDNLGKLMAGKLSPMLAFATGKLKVEGSKGVALKLAGMLDED